jgi:cytochrome b
MNDSTLETTTIRVWDWPVRVFHWSLALCVFIAYFTGESERYSWLHQTLGYAAAGLIAFRLVWGAVGTRYARFQAFVRGPQAVWAYLKSIRQGHAQHHVGHNPVGGVAVLLLMGLVVLTALSGWVIAAGDAPGWQEELHELAANTLMMVVAVHVLGVVLSSRLHRENLVLAMLSGFKQGHAHQGIARSWWVLGLLLLLALAAFVLSQLPL